MQEHRTGFAELCVVSNLTIYGLAATNVHHFRCPTIAGSAPRILACVYIAVRTGNLRSLSMVVYVRLYVYSAAVCRHVNMPRRSFPVRIRQLSGMPFLPIKQSSDYVSVVLSVHYPRAPDF